MKRAIAIVLLSIVTFSASAAWTRIYTTKSDTFYIDYASLQRDGDKRIFLQMTNYNQVTSRGDASSVHKILLDCGRGIYKDIEYQTYRGSNATGTISGRIQNTAWEMILPNTVDATIMRLLC